MTNRDSYVCDILCSQANAVTLHRQKGGGTAFMMVCY